MIYQNWRDSKTGAFSCNYNGQDGDIDNGPLFTAEAAMLGLLGVEYAISIIQLYEETPGCLKRYPTSSDYCVWDDHLGVSILSPFMADRVYSYFDARKWTLPNGKWIGRIPLLKPVIKAATGKDLNAWDHLKILIAYGWNIFEPKQETSGKILLFFSRRVLKHYWFSDKVIRFWTWRMRKLYTSPVEIFMIYFPPRGGENHPFVNAAPKTWDI